MEDIEVFDKLEASLDPADRPMLLPCMVEDPKWSEARKCHDWRNHVPEVVKEVWADLPGMAWISVYVMACQAAHAEEWD